MSNTELTVWEYIDSKKETLKASNRPVTSDNYGKAQRCLRRFCPNEALKLEDITEDFVKRFNEFLETQQIQPSTISFYNRTLRSIYNQAAKEGLIKNAHPFDEVNTKVVVNSPKIHPNKSINGNMTNLEDFSKEELLRRYLSLQDRYNSIVSKLSSIVGI